MTEDETFNALKKPPTEDEIQFGRNKWIYCDQHMRPHKTGWCTVSNRNKIALAATTDVDSYEECKTRNLKLYRG